MLIGFGRDIKPPRNLNTLHVLFEKNGIHRRDAGREKKSRSCFETLSNERDSIVGNSNTQPLVLSPVEGRAAIFLMTAESAEVKDS